MKKIARLLFVFFILALTMNTCELFENCETCSLVTEVDGVETNRTPGVVYCGDELEKKKNAEPVTIGSTTTYWDCH
jgi:hypothetical protein